MNNLLIFFALPIAVIIISIALQKIFKNSFLVAAIIFAAFLVATFVVNDLNLLIATIAYTILSFISAILTCVISELIRRLDNDENVNCEFANLNGTNTDEITDDVLFKTNVYPNNVSRNKYYRR